MANHHIIMSEDLDDDPSSLLQRRNVDKVNELSTSMMAGFTDSLKELNTIPQGEAEKSKKFMNSTPQPTTTSSILVNTNSNNANSCSVISASVNEQITDFFCFIDTGIELIEFSIWECAF